MNDSVIRLRAFREEYLKIASEGASEHNIVQEVKKKYPHLVAPEKGKEANALPGTPAQSRGKMFLHGMGKEIGPAAGALLGAGVGHMLGTSELASSGLGYGAGSIAQLAAEHYLKNRKG